MKTSILVGAAGLALSGAAFAGPWDAYPTEVREALESGAISPYQLTWMPEALFEDYGYKSFPVSGTYKNVPLSPGPQSFAGTEGTGGPFPVPVFFIDQFTGSPVGQTSGTYNFADFSNGIGGNPTGQTWEDQFNPTGTPILTFGGSNHVGVGDATTITGPGGSAPLTNGADWSNGGPPWLINAAGTQGRDIVTGQFAGDLSFIDESLFPSRASTGDDAWVYVDAYRNALERTVELSPGNFGQGVQFADRIFMGGTDFFGFSDPDGILRVPVSLSPLAGISGFATIVAQDNDPNGAANVPTDEWFSIAWHGSSSGPGTAGVSVWLKTPTAVAQGWLDPRMGAGDLIPPDGDPVGWINTAPGRGTTAAGADDDGDGNPDGMPLATDPDGNIADNSQDLGQAPVVNAFLVNSYHLGAGSFDPSDASTFSDMFWDNNIMDGTPIVQPCPVTDFTIIPNGFSDPLEVWDPLLPLRFQGGRFFVGSTGNAIINDFTFGSQTIQEQNETQSSVYDTGAVSMELPPVPALDQLNPLLGPDGVLFSADDDPVIFSAKFTVSSNPGQTGLSLVLTDDSVLAGGREVAEVHFGVDDPSTGIAQGPAGVGKHVWVRQPNVGGDGVYGVPPGFDRNANTENNLLEPNWVPAVEGLDPVLDALGPPFNVNEENIPASADGGSTKAVLPFNTLTEVEVRLLPNPNEDPDNPIDEGVAQIFLNGQKLTPAPLLIQNNVGTFQGWVSPGVDANGDEVWYAESPFPGEYAIGKHNNAAGAGDNAFIDDFFLDGPTLRETRVAGPGFMLPYNDNFETDENGNPTYPVDRPIAGQGDTGVLDLASVPDTRTFGQNSNPTTLIPLASPTTVDGDNVCRYLINEIKIAVAGIAAGDILAVNHDDLPDPFDTVNADNTDCPGQQGNSVQYMVRDATGLRIGQGEWTLLEQEPIPFNSSNEISTITLPDDATMGADGGWAVTVTSLATDAMGNPLFVADALVGDDPTAALAAGTTAADVLDAVQTQLDADLLGTGCTTARSTSGGLERLTITCASGDIAICEVQGFSDPEDTTGDGTNDSFALSAGPVDIANETLEFNGFEWNKLVEGGGDTNFAYTFLDLNRWGGDADQVMVRDLTGTPQEGASGHGQALCIQINNGVDGFPNFGSDNVLNGVLPEAVAREASGGDPATTARLEVSLYIESLDDNGDPVNQPPRDRFEIDFTGGRGNAGVIASVNFGGPNVNANVNLEDAGFSVLPPDAIGVSRDSGITTPEIVFVDSQVSLVNGGNGLTGPLVNKWIRFAFEVDPDGSYRMFIDEDADDGVDNFIEIDASTAIDLGQPGTGGIPVDVTSIDDLNIDVGNELGSGGEAALEPFRITLLEEFDVTTIFNMDGTPVNDTNGNGLADELELAASISADLDGDGTVGDTTDDNGDGFNDDAAPSDGGPNGRERSSLDWCIYSAAGLENFQADEVAPLVYRVNGPTGDIDPSEGLRTWQPLEDNFIAVLNKRRDATGGFLIGNGDGADEVLHDPCPIDPTSPDEVEIFDAFGNLMADTRWGLTGQSGLAGQLNPIPDGGIRLVGPRNVVGADGLIGTGDDNPDQETDGDGNIVGNGFPDGIAAYNDPTFFNNADVFPAPGPAYEAILLATWVDDADNGVDPFPLAPPNQVWYVDDLVIEEVEGSLPCPGNLNTDNTVLCPDGVTEAQTINGADLGVLLLEWSPADNSVPPGTPADLNGDLKVDGQDLGIILLGWGLCPGECP